MGYSAFTTLICSRLAKKFTYLLLSGLLFLCHEAFAQRNLIQQGGGRIKQLGQGLSHQNSGMDSVKHRDANDDSITVRFRYLDSTRNHQLDSTITDFTRRFPIPATNVYLGNTGTASRPILFTPTMQAGFDPGFHVFDIYRFTMEKARFFNTTRPYSELSYQIASRLEQIIELLYTQNIKPNWNFMFQYRAINSPGYYKNQKTNHNNYLFTSWYQSENKRYNAYLAIVGNKIQAGENGGLKNTSDLDSSIYKDRFNIYTNMGGNTSYSPDPFNTDIGTGNRYNDFTVLLRQQYDLGRKDSLVTDSTVVPLFFPRLRFEYTVQYSKRKYNFRDEVADSVFYKDNYAIHLDTTTSRYEAQDKWKEIVNDFSIYTFPDDKNLQQYFKVGAAIQNMSLWSGKDTSKLYNVFGHAEYRNRSRNQKWIIEANGKLYFLGLNAGDYYAYGSLQRFIGKRKGYAQIGIENVNRTPSFNFDPRSSFYLMPAASDFKKENTTHLFASMYQPAIRLGLGVDYYILTNYTYLTSYYQLKQESTLFNMLEIALQKTFKFGKHWYWHADLYYQQLVGNAEVNVPTLFTRNRIAYEGDFGFKNLNIAIGTEIRYHTPYDADNYSPILGRFFYQDSVQINNTRPDIAAYMHFRIRSFKLFFRAENLNTAQFKDGFGFTKNNFAAPGYPYQGLIIRLAVYWNFVN